MFTKKTRALSALLTVCMLISMLACFVVPAVAATGFTGFTDTSKMPDITEFKDYAAATAQGSGSFKITNRAGLEWLANNVGTSSRSFNRNYTFYLADDIDMEWENFKGIGYAGKNESALNAFKANFDGNGFVIKNLYMNQPDNYRVGLINYYWSSKTEGEKNYVRNVGIANGLIIGGKDAGTLTKAKDNYHDGVGSIIGYSYQGNLQNCWSAATVISTDKNAYVGGLVGLTRLKTTFDNCYFVGSLINVDDTASKGIIGVVDFTTGDPGILGATVTQTACYAVGDGKDHTAASLNGEGLTNYTDDYTVKYVDTEAGYPVLAFTEKGATEICRQFPTPTHGENAWLANGQAATTKVYLTLDPNGLAVQGTEENQTRKVTVEFTKGAEKLVYYSDATGKLMGADAADIEALYDCKLTDASGAAVQPADVVVATYESDATFKALNHSLAYTGDGSGKHTVTCENSCGYTDTEDCDNLKDSELVGDQVVAPTEDAEGYTRHLCSKCEEEWKSDVTAKLVVLKTNQLLSAAAGEELTIPVALKNDLGLKEMTVTVKYDANSMDYKGVQFADGVQADVNNDAANGILTIEVSADADLPELSEPVGAEALPALFKLSFEAKMNQGGTYDFAVSVTDAKDVNNKAYTTVDLKASVIIGSNRRGDFDLNNTVNLEDARMMMRYLALLETNLTEQNMVAGDVNGDGDVNMRDVVTLLRILSGKA